MARSPWLVALLFSSLLQAQESHIPLNDGWSFCQVGKERWYPAEVPGVVQIDLLRNGLIPDFYKGSNIDSVQWIENEDWIYKRSIVANDSLLKNGHVDLVFKGLDTFAEVYLNDSLLGKADNMFRTWEWPIKELLKPGTNELKVIFRSPITEGKKLRDAYGIQLPHDNDPSGVSPYIRKAAYQFGWDFCPRLVTCGIWQEVELRGWNIGRIQHVIIHQLHEEKRATVDVDVSCDIPSANTRVIKVRVNGKEDNSYPGNNGNMPGGGSRITVENPQYWWPNGSGTQKLYPVEVDLFCDGRLESSWHGSVGLRTIENEYADEEDGQSFGFKVNGKRMFMKGANLVPPSLLLPAAGDAAWVKAVGEMQRAHMNMARVWAGGVYPPDAFYDACDTAGILVWQDYMFANMVPGTSSFMDSVEKEAFEQQERLERHASFAIWCGNNELNVAWNNWGWQKTYNLHGSDSLRVDSAYQEMFDEEDGYLSPGVFTNYTPTSPLSNWGIKSGLRYGDLHYWGVWHGDEAFTSFKKNVGRFVSEYGFQSYPDSALLAKYYDPKELYLGSPTMKRMQRSYKTDKPIWDAIKRELGKEPKTLGEFIEDSQAVQAKAYRMAIEAHMAAQPHCMGTLFWQLNDCWPGPSWSLIDFDGKWKPGMYEVQRLYGAAQH